MKCAASFVAGDTRAGCADHECYGSPGQKRLGLLLAAGISWLITALTPIPMTITLACVVPSLVVSGSIGMIFGICPAWKAARLDPITAQTRN